MHCTTRRTCTLLCQLAAFLALFLAVSLWTTSTGVHAQTARHAVVTDVLRKRHGRKVIVVSLSRQQLSAYQGGHRIFGTAVTTGRPGLGTPAGTYSIFAKYSPTTFYSPFPRNSANWYPPTHINYALEWRAGYFLHDSWWRTVYGPGTTSWHLDPIYGWQPGSHGCISMPVGAAAWLYHWAPVGTVVRIVR
jgi:lipoprotein-anchoring transpeptidase ErfK/SrfK